MLSLQSRTSVLVALLLSLSSAAIGVADAAQQKLDLAEVSAVSVDADGAVSSSRGGRILHPKARSMERILKDNVINNKKNTDGKIALNPNNALTASNTNENEKTGHLNKNNNVSKRKLSKKRSKRTDAPTSFPTSFPTLNPTDDDVCGDLQPGYECGMAAEMNGYWAGEDKFRDSDQEACPGEGSYCSTALFDPRGTPPQNYFTFLSAYIDEGYGKTCADVGVNPKTGEVNGKWLRELDPNFNYVVQVEQKKCLPKEECPYNVVTESGFYDDYIILEQACVSHLEVDRLTNLFQCERYQINLLQKIDDADDLLVVGVLSYSLGVEGGYGNVVCPSQPTFDTNVLETDPNMDGILLVVKQGTIGEPVSVTNTTNWECKYGV